MKMSDVFILPVVAISDGRGGRFIPMESNQQAKAAAHAINQHDALTQLNKELVEALGAALIYSMEFEIELDSPATTVKAWKVLSETRPFELIKRAKELAE